jgi:hypothetical protein
MGSCRSLVLLTTLRHQQQKVGVILREIMAVNELFWDDLLLYLEEGRVVPIIGQELLTIPVGSESRNAYCLLGQRFMSDLQVTPVAGRLDFQLNQVVSENLNLMIDDRNQIYTRTKRAFDALKLPVPEPLRLLARIPAFRLFIPTTIDPWMKLALDEIRFGGQSKTELVAYNPKDATDVKVEQLRSGKPIVYQLYGRICGTPGTYAVTDEDTLEFFHHLLVQPPKLLCDELKDNHLLFIGNAFPDWLARFFIRTAREGRLSAMRDRVEFIVQTEVSANDPLNYFFRSFSRQTKFYAASPVEFVKELVARWEERHPPAKIPAPVTMIPFAPGKARAPQVFISYARDDIDAVRNLHQALEREGIDVWMDERELAGGEDWQQILKNMINACIVFLPVVSYITESRDSGQFRVEWSQAVDRLPSFVGSGREFIVPVMIDSVDFYQAKVPEGFKRTHVVLAPAGVPPPTLAPKIKDILRRAAGPEAAKP